MRFRFALFKVNFELIRNSVNVTKFQFLFENRILLLPLISKSHRILSIDGFGFWNC